MAVSLGRNGGGRGGSEEKRIWNGLVAYTPTLLGGGFREQMESTKSLAGRWHDRRRADQ